MDWSDFIFWWLEWPLKVVVTGILVVALMLLLNNIIALVFRGAGLSKSSTDGKYRPIGNMGTRGALKAQFGHNGKFQHLFKWYGWFWFKRF